MPIFSKTLRTGDINNPTAAIKAMYNHIQYLQEQLEYTLSNLDSANINEIATDITRITSTTGGVNLSGSLFSFMGKNGEMFEVGQEEGKPFQCFLYGKNGDQIFYLGDDGKFIITNNAIVKEAETVKEIDGGEW